LAAGEPSVSFIEPMKALRVPELPSGDWLYEMKFDGYRALAFKVGKEVRLVSRN
jgi:bifunctional non-homologous end joining protein LigD